MDCKKDVNTIQKSLLQALKPVYVIFPTICPKRVFQLCLTSSVYANQCTDYSTFCNTHASQLWVQNVMRAIYSLKFKRKKLLGIVQLSLKGN